MGRQGQGQFIELSARGFGRVEFQEAGALDCCVAGGLIRNDGAGNVEVLEPAGVRRVFLQDNFTIRVDFSRRVPKMTYSVLLTHHTSTLGYPENMHLGFDTDQNGFIVRAVDKDRNPIDFAITPVFFCFRASRRLA